MLKKTFLTATSALILSACPSKIAERFPANDIYITDLDHGVCAHYAIVDKTEFIVTHIADLELLPKGPCDGMVGFHRKDYPKIRNWIRNEQKSQIMGDETDLFYSTFDCFSCTN